MPDLLGEAALQEQVFRVLGFLIAQPASRDVLQTTV